MRVFTEASIKLIGDAARAKRNIPLARTFLGIMKSINSPTNQVQHWTRVLPDGTRIYVSSIHGRDFITIHASPQDTAPLILEGFKFDYGGSDSFYIYPPDYNDVLEFNDYKLEDYVDVEGPSWTYFNSALYYTYNGSKSQNFPGPVKGVAMLPEGTFVLTVGTTNSTTGLWREDGPGNITRVLSGSSIRSTSLKTIQNLEVLDNITAFPTTTSPAKCIAFTTNNIDKLAYVIEQSAEEVGGYRDVDSAIYTTYEVEISNGNVNASTKSVDALIYYSSYTQTDIPEISSPFPSPIKEFHENTRVNKTVSGNGVIGYLDPAPGVIGYDVKRYGTSTTEFTSGIDGRKPKALYYDEDGMLHTVYEKFDGTATVRIDHTIEAPPTPTLEVRPEDPETYYFAYNNRSELYSSPTAALQAEVDKLTISNTFYNWAIEKIEEIYPSPESNLYHCSAAFPVTGGFTTHRGYIKGTLKPGFSGDPTIEYNNIHINFLKIGGPEGGVLAGSKVYFDSSTWVWRLGGTNSITFKDGAPNPFLIKDFEEPSVFDLIVDSAAELKTEVFFAPEDQIQYPKTETKYSIPENNLKLYIKSTEGYSSEVGTFLPSLYPLPSFSGGLSIGEIFERVRLIPYWENEDATDGDYIVSTSLTNPITQVRQKAQAGFLRVSGTEITSPNLIGINSPSKYIGYISYHDDSQSGRPRVHKYKFNVEDGIFSGVSGDIPIRVRPKGPSYVAKLLSTGRDFNNEWEILYAPIHAKIALGSEEYYLDDLDRDESTFPPRDIPPPYMGLSLTNETSSLFSGEYSTSLYSRNIHHFKVEFDGGNVGPAPDKFHHIVSRTSTGEHSFDYTKSGGYSVFLGAVSDVRYTHAILIKAGDIIVDPVEIDNPIFSDNRIFQVAAIKES